jgi:hypothetical protein
MPREFVPASGGMLDLQAHKAWHLTKPAARRMQRRHHSLEFLHAARF